MDSLRSNFVDHGAAGYDEPDWDSNEDDVGEDLPPAPVGQDERRMQVRAYNFWASLLDDCAFPPISGLKLDELPDFAPFAVMLDFSKGIENPAITFLGEKLAEECGTVRSIRRLSDVPGRSLLSRITDHYMQILANQAPIGFEAEFVNQRNKTILYRGILLPFSNDESNIQHILGVINWKELVDQHTTDALLLEIDQALNAPAEPQPARTAPPPAPLAEWADGPAAAPAISPVIDLVGPEGHNSLAGGLDLPEPGFGGMPEPVSELDLADLPYPELSAGEADMGLADWLAAARELAQAAAASDDRTRHALYAAIGRAWDFALAAADNPEEFAELLSDAGLTMQARAPMTPVVKLVFGATYDKTRLTEYGSALGHAQRLGIARGALADYLAKAPGGLKGIVAEERRLRRAETGQAATPRDRLRDRLARKMRKLPAAEVSAEGQEFTVLLARRLANGEVVVLGEVADDIALLERAAKRLIG